MEVMDLAMIATLVVSFVLVKLLADWCDLPDGQIRLFC